MKKYIIVALLVAGFLAAPALAQTVDNTVIIQQLIRQLIALQQQLIALLNQQGGNTGIVPTPIYPPTTAPAITVLSPNGGETWSVGKEPEVRWRTNVNGYVYINLQFPRGQICYLDRAQASAGSKNVSLECAGASKDIATGNYKIILEAYETGSNRVTARDESDNYFTITSGLTQTSSIISANSKAADTNVIYAGELVYVYGTNLSSLSTVHLVGPSLSGDKQIKILQATRSTDTMVTFTAPTDLGAGTHYLSLVGRLAETNILPVTVERPDALSSITVLSPNGGEVWDPGTTQTIRWSSQNISAPHFLIDLIDANSGVVVHTIAEDIANVPGVGTHYWPIPTDFKWQGGNYKIRVDSSPLGTADTSDSYFTIALAPAGTPGSGNLPVGCTSEVGYSSITGESCGCTNRDVDVYNRFTGARCPR